MAASAHADVKQFRSWDQSTINDARLEDHTAPIMAPFRTKIALAWSDTGEKLLGSSGIRIQQLDTSGALEGQPILVPNTDTRRSPSLAIVGDRLWVAWIGSGDGEIYLARDNGPDKAGWERMPPPGKFSFSAPALCDMGGMPGLFWRGNDSRVRMSSFIDVGGQASSNCLCRATFRWIRTYMP
ncbi:hypothetical protein [Sphingomonas sp. S2-65]|uniref:hypothetical protein n=1 Tax=Sphingomonas sp. S2-65 TaxID=2903960 RepID=UPI001F3CC2EF|nr:hypothetical protein [Sphingomonas sp. S2-65]UYY57230.1 hypothetical protein LZ586_11080 [Sphingomonas sp. S2-65]